MKWSVNTADLKKADGMLRHRFRCYIEEWENVEDCGSVIRTKLFQKYGGLIFNDIDNNNIRITIDLQT